MRLSLSSYVLIRISAEPIPAHRGRSDALTAAARRARSAARRPQPSTELWTDRPCAERNGDGQVVLLRPTSSPRPPTPTLTLCT